MSSISPELRKAVQELAKNRCEYCLISEEYSYASFEIDHIIALKHGGLGEVDNLANSCPICNKYKGSDVASYDPESGELTPLFNPRKDKWSIHFKIANNGEIQPLTKVGRVTVKLLQLNKSERVKERKSMIEFNLLQTPQ